MFYEYFSSRGISTSTLDEFRVGWVPPYIQNILPDRLLHVAHAIGIIETREGKINFPYSNTVAFPMYDEHGDVVNFQFRLIDNENSDHKYINLKIRKKLQFEPYKIEKPKLFGGPHWGKRKTATLVEGPVDLLKAAEARLPNPVCLSGLMSLNPQEFLRFCKQHKLRLYSMLDWDTAGKKATANLCLEYTRNRNKYPSYFFIIDGPKDSDPGDVDAESLNSYFKEKRLSPLQYLHKFYASSIDQESPAQSAILHRFIFVSD